MSDGMESEAGTRIKTTCTENRAQFGLAAHMTAMTGGGMSGA